MRPVQLHGADSARISSLSVMVNGASAAAVISKSLAFAQRPSVGLHINFTEGCPVLPATTVPSLVADVDAVVPVMRGKMGFREALAAGAISLSEVQAELIAQVDRFMALHPSHAPPDHADGHQHVHVLPGVCEVVAEVLAAKGIRCVRLPALCSAEEPEIESMAAAEPARAAFYRGITAQCAAAKPVFERAGLCCADAFLGYSLMGAQMQVDRLLRLLDALLEERRRQDDAATAVAAAVLAASARGAACDSAPAPAATPAAACARPLLMELMCHPGHAVPAGTPPSAAGCGQPEGADDFAMSSDREHELAVLCSAELGEGLRERGVRIVTWPQLRAASLGHAI